MIALTGLDPKCGGSWRELIALAIFSSHRSGMGMDRIMLVVCLVTFGVFVLAAFATDTPFREAVRETVLPEMVVFAAITTI
ncbi:hypothetical protein RA263_28025, partial [Pseudomonas syringae pv. tagetis]